MAATHAVTLDGLAGRPVEVEVDISSGMPATVVVGLADTIVNEARDRVRAAVVNSGTSWPDQRVTINLAPSTLPKSGSHYDLTAALLVLVGADVGTTSARTAPEPDQRNLEPPPGPADRIKFPEIRARVSR